MKMRIIKTDTLDECLDYLRELCDRVNRAGAEKRSEIDHYGADIIELFGRLDHAMTETGHGPADWHPHSPVQKI